MEPQPSRLQRKERSHKRFTLLLPLGLSLHRGTLQLLLKEVHDGEKETTSSEIFLFCNSPEELKATFSFISYTANTFTWNALAELFKCDLKPLIHFTSLFYVLCFRKHPNFSNLGSIESMYSILLKLFSVPAGPVTSHPLPKFPRLHLPLSSVQSDSKPGKVYCPVLSLFNFCCVLCVFFVFTFSIMQLKSARWLWRENSRATGLTSVSSQNVIYTLSPSTLSGTMFNRLLTCGW